MDINSGNMIISRQIKCDSIKLNNYGINNYNISVKCFKRYKHILDDKYQMTIKTCRNTGLDCWKNPQNSETTVQTTSLSKLNNNPQINGNK